MHEILFAVIILLLILCFYWHTAEGFDTYYNHAMGAMKVYAKHPEYGLLPSPSISENDRYANYAWSTRSPAGMNVYDWYYEQQLRHHNTDALLPQQVDANTFLPIPVGIMVDPYPTEYRGHGIAQKNQ
jgi:hypothetical protein